MTSREFVYWLQGYFEIGQENKPLTAEQVEIIQKHLSMVFIHEVDTSYPPEQQDALNAAHSNPPGLAVQTPVQKAQGIIPRC